MKRTIHPANVIENDIVEFTQADYHKRSDKLIPKGTKAKFLEWIEDEGVKCAYASVIPIGIDTKGFIWTNPDILVIEE